MKALIIGGGGFLGRKLAAALAAGGRLRGAAIASLTLADIDRPKPIAAPFPVGCVAANIVNPADCAGLLAARPDVVFHLAAIVSGQAEAEFELGLDVNLHGALNVLSAARLSGHKPVVVFTSSIAVYGGDAPEPIGDWTGLNPQTSYGAQKAAAELFVNDYSRKGFVDGRALRLPTISIRPGKPNAAASSFMSSIFREPLQGRSAVCPVGPDYAHWYLSPRRCIDNLIHAANLPASAWGDDRRLMLPGRTYRIGEMVEAMRAVAGDDPVRRIRWEKQPEIERIVTGWKAHFDPARALSMGFARDVDFADHIRYFLEDDLEQPEGAA